MPIDPLLFKRLQERTREGRITPGIAKAAGALQLQPIKPKSLKPIEIQPTETRPVISSLTGLPVGRTERYEPVKIGIPEFLTEIPKAKQKILTGIGKFVHGVFQEIAKSGGSIAMSLTAPITGKRELAIDPTAPQLEQEFQKFIFGKEPIKAIETRIAEAELDIQRFAQQTGMEFLEKGALPTAVIGIGAMIGLDFTLVGGKAKALSAIAKTDDIIKITKLLKGIKGVPKGQVNVLAKTLSKLDNVKSVEKAIGTSLTKPISKFLPEKLKKISPKIVKPEPILLKAKLRAEARGAKRAVIQYKKEQRLIESIERDVARELAKPKARQRSTIAFVKKIGELNQTVVSEVKTNLRIDKPISKMNLDELQDVLGGLKERLAFKIRRGFKPAIVEKTSKAPKIADEMYISNRATKEIKKTKMVRAREAVKEIGKGADILLAPISTRLKNINIDLKRAIRSFEFSTRMKTQKDLRIAEDFLKSIKPRKVLFRKARGMSINDYLDYDLALKNGDIIKIKELNGKYRIQKQYNATRQILDDIYKRADDVGFDIGYAKNYHPRMIKDSDGFLKYLGQRDDWSRLDEAIKRKEMQLGRYLDNEEKANLINNMIRGYGRGQITLSGTGAMKHRIVDFIDPELNRFYADSSEALVRYITQTNDAIEARKFFGKARLVDKKIDQFNNIKDGIGSYVTDLLAKGQITVDQEKTLTNILKARFAPRGTSGIIGIYKNLSYIDVMGSPINALTQIGDLGFSIYKAGPLRILKELPRAIIGKAPIKKVDLGITRIAQEFTDPQKSGKAVDVVFKAIGLDKIDAIGKETLVNGVLRRLRHQAKNPTKKFMKELQEIFGKETSVVIRDLKAGQTTENVKYIAFNKLLDFQPVALSEVPEMYLKSGNGRIFYMLKTWTLKMLDVYRNEAFQLMKNKETFVEGFGNMMKLSASLMAAEITADVTKDIIMGRKMDLKDRVVDSVLKLVTLNRYTIRKSQEQGLGSAFVQKIFPPTQFIDNVWKDVAGILRDSDESFKANELRTIKSIPFGGKLYYWWFGKAATYKEKEPKVGPTGLPRATKKSKVKISPATGLPR